MSLINQMLKDLERRTKSQTKPDTASSNPQSSIISLKQNNKIERWETILYLLFVILVIILFSKPIIQHYYFKKTHNQILLPSLKQASFNEILLPNQPITMTTLTGVTLQILQDVTSLRFSLSQNALYRVDKTGQNKVIIYLDQTQLVTSLPPIDYTHSALQKIQMINEKTGDLKIILTLKTGSEIKNLELNNGKFPELKLDLLQHAMPVLDSKIAPLFGVVVQQLSPIKKLVSSVDVQSQYQNALNLAAAGQTHESIRILTQLTNQFPDYYLAREELVKLLIQQGNTFVAKMILKTGLERSPMYAPFIELRAHMLADEGKPKQALDLLRNLDPPVAENPEYYALMAALAQQVGDSMLSAKLYEQLLKIYQGNATWWVGLGIALESLGNHNQALLAYSKANGANGLTPELSAYIASQNA